MNKSFFHTIYKKSMGHNFMCLTPCNSSSDNNSNDNESINCYNHNNDFRTKMVLENTIDGLLPLHIQYTNDIPTFQYDISGYQSLNILCDAKSLSYSHMCLIVSKIYHTLISCEKYLLKYDHILFYPEQIFLTSDFEKIGLCYFPLNQITMQLSLQNLFEYLLKKIDHKDEKCVFLTYSLHSECMKYSLTPDTLLSYISMTPSIEEPFTYEATSPEITFPKVTTNQTNTISQVNIPSSQLETQNNTSKLKLTIQKPTLEKTLLVKILLTLFITISIFIGLIALYILDILNLPLFIFSILILFLSTAYNGFNIYKELEGPLSPLFNDETSDADFDIINNTCCTTLLSSPDNNDFHKLIYTGTDFNDEIQLTCYPFTIGKSEGCNHIFSNPIISRLHAKLTCIPSVDNTLNYYLEDLNSTNGTQLNNLPLTPYEKYPLKSGDYISFGHLTYIFH